MKYKKILRLLGIIAILSMLMAVIPVTPVLAAGETISLNPAQVKIGDRVNYSGTGYVASSTTDYYIDIYITDQAVSLTTIIDTGITRYKRVIQASGLNTDGTYVGYFTLTAANSILNEGAVGTVTPVTMTAGATYYVFSTGVYTQQMIVNDPAYKNLSIKAWATLTITAGATLDALTPATGAAGTTVSVTGANFPASTALTFLLDSATALTPTGDTSTRASGLFISNITIPAGAAAGAHTITVTAGASTATATFTVTASASLDTFTPASGPAGTLVTITGANFPANTPIVFKFDTTVFTPNTGAQTGAGGTIASVITVPTSATAGAHTISVTVGTATVSKEFSVTAAATTTPPTTTPPTTTPPTTTPPTTPPATGKAILSINSSGHAVGSTIGIGGAGFTPGATVTIKYDAIQVTTTKVETNGTFISPFFTAPASVKGDHTITVTDGVNTATTKFTMESTSPKTPQPLKPQDGAKVKSPITFDWADVTDDSKPVTYNLQIATDSIFSASSLVLNKTGLDSSGYTMTELEELKLTNSAAPYYWREKAVDGASNESEWTGAGKFYIPEPFKIPTWGIYVGAAVGALLFFLIGLMVGRRTAFMY
jgi:hypothetical protein